MSLSLSLEIFFLLALIQLSISAQCYLPDKSTSTDIPCSSNGTVSVCCSSDSYCLSNGLCITNMVLSRGSCTDQTWKSPSCPQHCRDVNPSGGAMVAFCFPSSWSCKPETCLNDNFTLPNGQLVLREYQKATLGIDASNSSAPAHTTSTISVASATVTSFMTMYATQYPPFSTIAPTAPPAGMVTTSALTVRSAVVGITVGLPMLIIALISFTVIARERWRYRKLVEENNECKIDMEFYRKLQKGPGWYELSTEALQKAQEVGMGSGRVEMGSGQSRVPTPARNMT